MTAVYFETLPAEHNLHICYGFRLFKQKFRLLKFKGYQHQQPCMNNSQLVSNPFFICCKPHKIIIFEIISPVIEYRLNNVYTVESSKTLLLEQTFMSIQLKKKKHIKNHKIYLLVYKILLCKRYILNSIYRKQYYKQY